MSNTDPRPMPSSVRSAYKRPLNLFILLTSGVYSSRELELLRRDFQEFMIRTRGMIDVQHGPRQTMRLDKALARIKSPSLAIGKIVNADDYGGAEGTCRDLASFMEPGWQAWWKSQAWTGVSGDRPFEGIADFIYVSRIVLGHRQLSWLAAQYARYALSSVRMKTNEVAMAAIEAAESWAESPGESRMQAAGDAAREAWAVAENFGDLSAEGRAVTSASYAAWTASTLLDGELSSSFLDAAGFASLASALVGGNEEDSLMRRRREACGRLCELTKQLITPSLVDAI